MVKIRQMTGFCPQHDILLDQLTVKEHLQIFAGIKNLPLHTVDAEVSAACPVVLSLLLIMLIKLTFILPLQKIHTLYFYVLKHVLHVLVEIY